MNPVVTALVGAVPLLATNPTCEVEPEVGMMYNDASLMEDMVLDVIVHGTVVSLVSVDTVKRKVSS